jgi:hypothetical protein
MFRRVDGANVEWTYSRGIGEIIWWKSDILVTFSKLIDWERQNTHCDWIHLEVKLSESNYLWDQSCRPNARVENAGSFTTLLWSCILWFTLTKDYSRIYGAECHSRVSARIITTGKGNAVTTNCGDLWKLASCCIRDTDLWLKINGESNEDVSICKSHLLETVKCATEEELNTKYDTPKKTWSQPFLSYFTAKWLPRVRIGFHGYLRSIGLQQEVITTNMSESLNAVLKRMHEWEEVILDVMLLTAYKLQLCHYTELQRSRQGFGPYCLVSSSDSMKHANEYVFLVKQLLTCATLF